MKKWITLFDLLCLGFVLLLIDGGTRPRPHEVGHTEALPAPTLVVLAESGDPYAVLADEIAQVEDALRLYTIKDLKTIDAAYVLYVASPAWLTEHKLLMLSTLSATTGRYPAVGIISGSTLAQARTLWLRGAEVRAGQGFAASAPDVNAGLDEGRIWDLSTAPVTTLPLTKDNLLHALESADYVYWARHVGTRYWFWYEREYPVADQRLSGDDLPALRPMMIHTPSCRSFVPWAEDSIALAFTDHGAAAYLGHLYSPISSAYFIGHLQTLPGYNTWPDVPIGILAQVQNRASERAFATQPYLFMLGDPRIALQPRAPYTITSDMRRGRDSGRVIQGYWEPAGATPGILPLRIADGATYPFIEVKGIGAVADSDPFYNRSVQTLNVQEDKVALILHPGGAFEVMLRTAAPPLWRQADALHDAFEFVWCSIAPLQTPLGLLPLALLLGVGIVKRVRKKSLRPYMPALGVGLGWTTLQLAFCLFRSGRVSVTSYQVQPTLVELGLAFVGTSGVVMLGLVRMLDAQKPMGKLLGLGICIAPTLALGGFYISAVIVLNIFMAQKSGESFWPLNYASVRMIAIVGIIEAVVFLNGYRLLRKSQQ